MEITEATYKALESRLKTAEEEISGLGHLVAQMLAIHRANGADLQKMETYAKKRDPRPNAWAMVSGLVTHAENISAGID